MQLIKILVKPGINTFQDLRSIWEVLNQLRMILTMIKNIIIKKK